MRTRFFAAVDQLGDEIFAVRLIVYASHFAIHCHIEDFGASLSEA